MDDLTAFDLAIVALLKSIADGCSAEGFVPVEASPAGYRTEFFDLTQTGGNWVGWSYSTPVDMMLDVPLIWFNDNQEGDPAVGKTGFGFYPTLFSASGPDAAQLRQWRAGGVGMERLYGQFKVADLYKAHPLFRSTMVPVFDTMIACSRDREATRILDREVQALKDEANGVVWLFCIAEDTTPSVTSSAGILKLVENFRLRVKKSTSSRLVVFHQGDSAYLVLIDPAGWSVKEKRTAARTMPPGVAWFRTGVASEWWKIDTHGFGVSTDSSYSALCTFLKFFSNHGSTSRVIQDVTTDPFGSPYPLLATLSAYPKGKAVDGFSKISGPMWSICRELSQKGKVHFWWLS